MIDRRHLLGVAGVVALGVGGGLLAGCGGSAGDAGSPLRTSANKGDDSTYMARAGLADTPYRLENVTLPQASVALEALSGGGYDFGLSSNISPAFISPGSPIRYGGFHAFDPTVFKLYVQGKSPIRSPGDLKGKRIGYMRGGPLHIWLLEILRAERLTLRDVKAIPLSALDSVAAFIRGDLDAVLVGYVAPSWQAESAGARILVRGDAYPHFARINGFSLAVHEKALADPAKRAAIADYMKRLRGTWDWIDAHEEEWAQEQARIYGVPASFIPGNRPRPRNTRIWGNDVGIANATAVAEAFASAGAIPSVPDIASFFDPQVEALLPLSPPAGQS
ncbi:ABC transporter substrate-binding protein [Tsuneonella sp. CC-YZS046]|uniref:ABC transporter substrate-binding protein n=1 Tax=Tsuneonella sp. CC-YZS046 TaxID=3042152 RepID=UPI002D782B30|nr:ABC transporter substrate-binding protein [Tsuneonella sp. CC-YZS046]WRO66624.1 ABC transporter substrate-binding protein [Tsuneonella sp. CC-YZS046]